MQNKKRKLISKQAPKCQGRKKNKKIQCQPPIKKNPSQNINQIYDEERSYDDEQIVSQSLNSERYSSQNAALQNNQVRERQSFIEESRCKKQLQSLIMDKIVRILEIFQIKGKQDLQVQLYHMLNLPHKQFLAKSKYLFFCFVIQKIASLRYLKRPLQKIFDEMTKRKNTKIAKFKTKNMNPYSQQNFLLQVRKLQNMLYQISQYCSDNQILSEKVINQYCEQLFKSSQSKVKKTQNGLNKIQQQKKRTSNQIIQCLKQLGIRFQQQRATRSRKNLQFNMMGVHFNDIPENSFVLKEYNDFND